MTPHARKWVENTGNALQWLCLAGANWFTLCFLYVAFSSLDYPFNLEWMEGQSIDVIKRILDGKPYFARPSLEYVPYIYTPLYFYVSALVAKITGVGFLPARLVSTLAAMGVGYVMFLWIRRRDGDWQAGLIGAGLFYATYRLSGRWFDNSRVDSLFLFFALSGLYVFLHFRGAKYAAAAGVLAALAFFTKQSVLILILPTLFLGLFHYRRDALIAAATLAALVGAGVFIGNYLSGGWFNFYVFELPASHNLEHKYIIGYWRDDMLRALGGMCFAAALLLAVTLWRDRALALRYGAVAAGLVACSYASRLHWGGYMNVLMPMHACLALMTGLALSGGQVYRRATPFVLVAVAALLQMKQLAYNPNTLIPSQQSRDAGERFLEDLANVEGDIFIPELQYVQTRAGKTSYTLGMAAYDIMRADLKERGYIKKEFMDEIGAAVASGRFAGIIPGRLVPTPQLFRYYMPHSRLVFPREYVTGAINFLRTDLFKRIPERRPLKNQAEP
jgi:hypothetical protein